jgi:hypothetical protein
LVNPCKNAFISEGKIYIEVKIMQCRWHYGKLTGHITMLTSAVACAVIMLMTVPEGSVRDAGLSSAVLAANVAPTGTAAVTPVVSTHTSLGKYRKETTQLACVEGTVTLDAPAATNVADHLLLDGIGA